MKLLALTPLLRTHDLQGTTDFYTGLLGFERGAREFALLQLGQEIAP